MPADLHVVDDLPAAFAERVIDAFHSRPHELFSLALTGGPSAQPCYEQLARRGDTQIDWWKVDVYWTDERCLGLEDHRTNYHLAREALLDRVGAANATYPMRCDEGPDPYQLRIGELGRIDLVHLTLASDGHPAALFPGSSALHSDPGRLVVMNEDPSLGDEPSHMTLTLAGIARARQVLLTVAGAERAAALRRVWDGDETAPAARVTGEDVVWVVDRDAAAQLDT